MDLHPEQRHRRGILRCARLNEGDSVTDSFTVVVTDDNGASDTQTVVVSINGTNDEPVLSFSSGNDQGSVTEDSIPSTSGTLSSSDIDQNSDAYWSIDGSGLGTYGSISIDENGTWTYTLDNGIDGTSSVVQDSNQGDSVTDSFTVVVTDDNGASDTQTVVVTINGSNDEPVLSFSSGEDQGSVTEDSILSTSGTLSSSDIDQNSDAYWSIDGSGVGAYGSISVDENGTWTYTLDNGIDGTSSVVQDLNQGQSVTDSFTVVVTDDNGASDTQTVVVTINGSNDAPVLQGESIKQLDAYRETQEWLAYTNEKLAYDEAYQAWQSNQDLPSQTPEAAPEDQTTSAPTDLNVFNLASDSPVTGPSDSGQILAEALSEDFSNGDISFDAIYNGSLDAASTFDGINFGFANTYEGQTVGLFMGGGIALSTGSADPDLTNSRGNFSVDHGTPGDSKIESIAGKESFDASSLEINFKTTEEIESISLDFMFGSEEFAEYVDTNFVDFAAILLDGVNYAYFNNEPSQVLSIRSESIGNYFANTHPDEEVTTYEDQFAGRGEFAIEYDGISAPLNLNIDLDYANKQSDADGRYTHNLKFAIADTGDGGYDSTLFISGSILQSSE